MPRKKKTKIIQTITDPEALDALIQCFRTTCLEQEEMIVKSRKLIIKYEDLTRKVKAEGKYVQIIESNVR